MNHTKGTWKVTHDTVNDYIDAKDENGFNMPIACTYSGKVGRDSAKANAKLIASTPEMYAALNTVKENMELNLKHNQPVSVQEMNVALSIINAALNKATGNN